MVLRHPRLSWQTGGLARGGYLTMVLQKHAWDLENRPMGASAALCPNFGKCAKGGDTTD